MKNFCLGVLVMLVVGLYIQNSHLQNQVTRQNKSTPSAPKVAKKVAPKQAVVVKQKTPVIVASQYLDGKPLYNEAHDPRCPSHLPYYDSHWGCVVKRP